MRSLRLLLLCAAMVGAGQVLAQQFDPVQSKAIDEAYRGRCEAVTSKELCSCVIEVAGVQIDDPTERQVFFDFMMGDVDKAKATRAVFPPEKNMKFNIKLQKADVMLGDRCDRLKPKQDAPAKPQGEKLP